jgi:hypothetical protein
LKRVWRGPTPAGTHLSPERQQQLKELYNAALERAAGDRPSFLEEVCAGDEDLRGELETLFGNQARTESFIETRYSNSPQCEPFGNIDDPIIVATQRD